MEKRQIMTAKAPAPLGAYSQALRAGDFVYTAGMGPVDPESGKIVGRTIQEQTERTLRNLQAVLEAAGLGMKDVVKATVHLGDMGLFAGFNEVYARFFPDPKPVRTTVGSTLAGILVEIDLVAYAGS